ncbi:MAG: LPS export ABC transporter periplasmic protein LptC [Candidatus Omnitrophota bacterium]
MVKKTGFFLVSFMFCCALSLALAETIKENTESDQQVNDFALSGYGDKGKKSWDLSGKSADIFNDTVKLKAVSGNLYDEKEDIKLTADRGDFNKKTSTVHLEDNVVVTTSGGAKLTSDTLDWDRKEQLVSTLSRVNLTKQELNLQGEGASAQTNLKKVQVNKDVRLDIHEKPAKNKTATDKMVITCTGPLDIDYGKNIAVFNNNVRVERPDSVILSDRLEVYFNSGKRNSKPQKSSVVSAGSIDRIVASGHVQILQGENVSYSEKAVYTAADQKLTLDGAPRLVIYQTEKMSAAFRN